MRRGLASLFIVVGLVFATVLLGAAPASAVIAACDDGSSAQNAIKVKPTHGRAFYIDSSTGIDAAYVGYTVTATSAKTNLWVKLDSFAGGAVALANPSDASYPIGDLALNGSKPGYFLLKALAGTTRTQTHVVSVYSGNPNVAGNTPLYQCTYTFTKVKDTIKASSNKVSTITNESITSKKVGDTFTISVEGNTGTVGAGGTPDYSAFWSSPASKSTWPTYALRLEKVQVGFGNTGSKASTCVVNATGSCYFENQLLVSDMSSLVSSLNPGSVKSLDYKTVYTFRITGKTVAAATVEPVIQIASGTQIKHNILASGATGVTLSTSTVSAPTFEVTKALSATAAVSGASTTLSYTINLKNTGAASGTVDQVRDVPASGLTYVPGSAKIRTINSSSGAEIVADAVIGDPSTATDGSNTFSGPFVVANGNTRVITYKMSVNTCLAIGSSYSYSNSATASIGSTLIGSSGTTMSQTTAVGSCGSTTLTSNATSNVTLVTEATTLAATGLSATSATAASATLNGTVNPNGTAGQSVTFEYGTSPTLAGATVVTKANTTSDTTAYAVSHSLTTLVPSTVYYYRINAGSVSGQIVSFVAPEQASPATVTTDVASPVSASSATLNATLDPNLNTTTAAFEVCVGNVASCSSPSTVTILDDQTNGASGTASFTGSFPTQFSIIASTAASGDNQSGLSLSGSSYVTYRAKITYTPAGGSATTLTGIWRTVQLVTTSSQAVTFNAIDNQTFTTGSITVSPTLAPVSGLAITMTSETTGVCTVAGPSAGVFTVTFVTAGDCVLTASQSGGVVSGTTYSAAEPVTQGFNISVGARTLSLDPIADVASWSASGASALATANAGDNDGAKSYSVVSGPCSVNANTGALTYTGTGTCVVSSSISQGLKYGAASSSTRSFVIGKRNQSLTFNNDSNVSAAAGTKALSATSSSDGQSNLTGIPATVYALVNGASNTAGCSLSGATLSFTQAGACSVTASKGGNDHWNAASDVTATFTMVSQSRTLTLAQPSEVANWTSTGPTLSATASADDSSGAKTYSVSSGPCTVDSSTGVVTPTGAGICVVTATIGQGSRYNSAIASSKSFAIGKRSQTITFSSDANVSASTGTKSLNATSNSDGGSHASDLPAAGYVLDGGATNTAGCAVSGTTLSFTRAGECSVVATKGGNDHWNAAENATATFTMVRQSRTLTLSQPAAVSDWAASGPTLSASTADDDSDGTKSYSKLSGPCTVDGNTGVVTPTGAGTCVVSADITQGDRFNAASSTTKSFTIGKRDQVLTFNDQSFPLVDGSATVAAVTDASSNLGGLGDTTYALTGGAANTANCTVDAYTGLLAFSNGGTCSVTARKSGNAHWNDALAKTAVFTISNKPGRSLGILSKNDSGGAGSYDPAGYASWSSTPPTLKSEANHDNGDTKSYSLDPSSTGCTVNSSTGEVAFTGAGTCKVVAHINEGSNYLEAYSSTVSFTIGKRDQELSFDGDATLLAGDAATNLHSSVSPASQANDTGLSTGYAITGTNTAGCSLSNGVLEFTSDGVCHVTASRGSNSHWNPAADRTATFTVSKSPRNLTISDPGDFASWTDTPPAMTSLADHEDGNGTKSYALGSGSTGCTVDASAGAVSFTGAGTCKIVASITSSARFHGASSSARSFAIGRADRSITVADPGSFASWSENGPNLTATPSAGSGEGTKSFALDPASTGCTVNATTGQVSFTGAGTCKVTSTISQGTNYNQATSSVRSFTIGPRAQTLALTGGTLTFQGAAHALHATTNANTNRSGMPGDSFAIDGGQPNSANCSVVAGELQATGWGECYVTASNGGNTHWTSANSNSARYVVKRTQSINLPQPADLEPGASAFDPGGSATSGLAVSYTASPANVCEVTNTGRIRPLADGECTVTASQGGDDATYWFAATDTQVRFSVRSAQTTPTPVTPAPTPTPEPTPDPSETPTAVPQDPALGAIEGQIWIDQNKNGKKDEHEPFLPFAPVQLDDAPTRGKVTVSSAGMIVYTDSNGFYTFKNVVPAVYEIKAIVAKDTGLYPTYSSDGSNDWTVKVNVKAATTVTGDLAAAGPATISGPINLQLSDRLVPDAVVSCVWAGIDGKLGTADDVTFSAHADVDGIFTIAGMPFGSTTCQALDPATGTAGVPMTTMVSSAGTAKVKLAVPEAQKTVAAPDELRSSVHIAARIPAGKTVHLVTGPIRTKAGHTPKVRVTCTPIGSRTAVRGDVAACQVWRGHRGGVFVRTTPQGAFKVTLMITTKRTAKFGRLHVFREYRTT